MTLYDFYEHVDLCLQCRNAITYGQRQRFFRYLCDRAKQIVNLAYQNTIAQ